MNNIKKYRNFVEETLMRFSTALLLAAPFLAASVLVSTPSVAQTSTAVLKTPGPSRVDLYGGYAYFHPMSSGIGPYLYQPINPGAVASITGYFNRTFGIQAEGGFHPSGPDDCVYTAQAGPVVRHQYGRLVPFVHALGGSAKVGGPVFQPCTWGWGVTGGLGVDYILSKHFALRPIQADYQHSHVDYGTPVANGIAGGTGIIDAYRLSAGVVIRFGDMTPAAPLQLTCGIQPASAYPGDPLIVTASALNVEPKKKITYTWSSNGGKVTASDATASIDTSTLAPGDYVVMGHASQGNKPVQQASCTTAFSIKAFEPPTVSCSAVPSTVQLGGTSTITATGTSPQNRPLTYSYTASVGQISGNTNTATLTTQGASPGPITITCNTVDDRGQSASTTTQVTVSAPPPALAPQTRALCSISFERDLRRPTRVDNEAKGCLDDIALTLEHDITARLVITGHYNAKETPASAAQRALNVRQYLTTEKAIDPSRIEVRTGDDSGKTVNNTFVPSGATFDSTSTTAIDTSAIHQTGEAYGKPRR